MRYGYLWADATDGTVMMEEANAATAAMENRNFFMIFSENYYASRIIMQNSPTSAGVPPLPIHATRGRSASFSPVVSHTQTNCVTFTPAFADTA